MSEIDDLERAYLICQKELYTTKKKLEIAISALRDISSVTRGVALARGRRGSEYIHNTAKDCLDKMSENNVAI